MTRHVSTENLARFRGGDLSTVRSARIAAHLRACARCRETSEALAEVPSLLAAVEVPPMPAHLAARIESALATESARREAVESDSAPGHQRRSHAGARHRPRRPAMPAIRVLATAGAAVVVVGGFVALLTQLGTGASSGTNGGAATSSVPRHKSADLGPRTTPGYAFGMIHYQAAGHTAVITPERSGTHYQTARLTQQVSRVMATSAPLYRGSALPNATSHSSTSSGTTARSVPTGCVNRIAAGHRVQLVDIARFDGRPATIIVTAPHGQVAAQVFVVGAACSASASDVLAHRPLPRH